MSTIIEPVAEPEPAGPLLSVDPNELRASAAAARTLAEEFGPPSAAAPAAALGAAGELAGWPLGPALAALAHGWEPVLRALAAEPAASADALEASACGHERNDGRLAGSWR
ncbi:MULTISPECIES: hypothetical protein [Kitasatospora]|uniref:Uncharacterized protein n=1 Tax=Kitasatospora setae (strain ATCC 33774 / DSM 43861 / JCM 3304 / KCC A-0304 / NBRC 14216 / KM-6054) TaxID=452652 RepID=E4N647_KITSK|nr:MULTISPECIES: hypothetical protein [Kitasatospora]BAJ26678.1 hypothetical protein KSE_08390 [Kitasatospora setae KM-6054]